MNSQLRVKICCIQSIAEAELAIACGADALGLVSEMPSGPGVISEARIAEIAAQVPAGIATFLLTSKKSVEDVLLQHRRCRTTTIQICDSLQPGDHATLKRALPEIEIVQAIHVNNESALHKARALAPHVEALLLDSGEPDARMKTLGGTGHTHNWLISARICRKIDKPVYLAGGLNPQNIGEAVETVQPFGVDVCSGVRRNGQLDQSLLKAFFQNLPGK